MKSKKAVLFDMDGVLVDTEAFMQHTLSRFFQEETTFSAKDLRLELFIGSSGQMEVWRQVFANVEAPVDFEDLNRKLFAYLKDIPIPYEKYQMPHVKSVLSWLREQKILVGLASSSKMENIRRMLNSCGLESYFDGILSGEQFRESKPNPEIYQKLAQILQVDADQCVVVEDSFYGILSGKRAGMRTVALKDNRFGMDQSQADETIESLAELPGLLEGR